MVHDLAVRTLERLGHNVPLPSERVRANCDYVGDGYGIPTDGMVEAVNMLAQLEGLLFDPVYSGKALDGLISLARKDFFAGMKMLSSSIPGAVRQYSPMPAHSTPRQLRGALAAGVPSH